METLPVRILTLRLIPNLSGGLAKALGLDEKYRAVGLISTDSDDVTYMALDEATKVANVEVVYARSLYAGAKNATTALAGEVIGILAGPTTETKTVWANGAPGIPFRRPSVSPTTNSIPCRSAPISHPSSTAASGTMPTCSTKSGNTPASWFTRIPPPWRPSISWKTTFSPLSRKA